MRRAFKASRGQRGQPERKAYKGRPGLPARKVFRESKGLRDRLVRRVFRESKGRRGQLDRPGRRVLWGLLDLPVLLALKAFKV